MVKSLLQRPEEGAGSIERQSAHAKALVMLAKVHKVWGSIPFSSDQQGCAVSNSSGYTVHPVPAPNGTKAEPKSSCLSFCHSHYPVYTLLGAWSTGCSDAASGRGRLGGRRDGVWQ